MKIKNLEINGKVFLGPMAGTTNTAFRVLCKKNGASLVFAEMVSTEGLVHNNEKTKKMVYVDEQEHPIALQIFGFDENSFVTGTKIVNQLSECDIIDINMGCPAPKVAIRSQAGANLLKYPEKVEKIIKAVCQNTDKPVTVKMRIGWDENSINCVELAKAAEAAGASAITIHGRTRKQFYQGKANWEWIKKVKDAVKIPVIGNGDVVDGPSAKKMLEETGCDAIMIARASQGNPWIFREIEHYLNTGEELPKPTFKEWKEAIIEHSNILINMRGEELAMKEMRKQLLWYIGVLPKNQITLDMKKKSIEINCLQDIMDVINLYNEEK